MSAVTPAATVDQLARSLHPHQVLVHHDFSQTPDFVLAAPNVQFVPEPCRTGWASFGFVEGIFHSLRHALAHLEFDYLQLLSPTCLPIKPLAAFEAHVAQGVDAHFGAIDLLGDRECLMSVGYRAFTPEGTLRHRVLRRLSSDYFAQSPLRRDEAGVWIRAGRATGWRSRAAYAITRAMAMSKVGRHPFGDDLRPYYGSVWFGARKPVVRGLVEGFADARLHTWASRMRISEEFVVPTLLMRVAGSRGHQNHHIRRFNGAHPSWMSEQDLPVLRASTSFFARKFPEDPACPVRLRVLAELVEAPGAAQGARTADPPEPPGVHVPAAHPPLESTIPPKVFDRRHLRPTG